jgi:hypothetical protein
LRLTLSLAVRDFTETDRAGTGADLKVRVDDAEALRWTEIIVGRYPNSVGFA